MKDAARLNSAIELLSRMQAARIPMDAVIQDFMKARRFIGSKDRTAIVERVYRIMRAQARLGWWLSQNGVAETSSRGRVIADLAFHDGLTLETSDEIFTDGKYDPAPLEEDEKKLLAALQGKALSDPAMPVEVRAECPAWAAEKLRPLFGDDFESQLSAMIEPATLDLRVNTTKGSVEEAMASLKADHVNVSRTSFSPIALRADSKTFMGDTKAFRSGLVEIQDEGSQLIGLICDAKPGMRVLDYCAGGGGKTLVLAAMMENKGNIVAMDNDTRRLEKGKPRYKKAGVHNVELRSLEEEQSRKWLRRQKATMDVVLIDAPCSSSGTWRRNPDLRWREFGPKLASILETQAEILDKVADKVKPGGRIVYATCSLFPEENEYQVAAFLSRHPDFSILPLEKAWPDVPQSLKNGGDFLRLYPSIHKTDGFFAAALIRA